MANLNNKLEYINEKVTTDTKQFIKDCEKEYQSIIDKIVKKIIEEDGREIIMLAGPSSAGKTTTAKRLKEGLSEKGVTTYVLSLDDFYLNRDDIPYLPPVVSIEPESIKIENQLIGEDAFNQIIAELKSGNIDSILNAKALMLQRELDTLKKYN